MVRICVFAVIAAAMVLVCSFGCGQQGAGNAPSGSTEQATSPGESRQPPTTTEETTMPLGLECPNDNTYGAQLSGPPGRKGKKGDPVEIARREFSKKIRKGDMVQIADRSRGPNATASVSVIREGRVVAHIEYRRAREGWLQDSFKACSNF